jgi:hypothetical protein
MPVRIHFVTRIYFLPRDRGRAFFNYDPLIGYASLSFTSPSSQKYTIICCILHSLETPIRPMFPIEAELVGGFLVSSALWHLFIVCAGNRSYRTARQLQSLRIRDINPLEQILFCFQLKRRTSGAIGQVPEDA